MGLDARTKPSAKHSVKWSLFFALGAVLVIVVSVSTARETYREWKVDQEIQSLQWQVQSLEGKKFQLNQLLARIQSDEALDQEARSRFGMKKPGEKVFVIRGDMGNGTEETLLPATPPHELPRSNPQKWVDYFFTHSSASYGTTEP